MGIGLVSCLAGGARGECGNRFDWFPDASDPEMQSLWIRAAHPHRCLLAPAPAEHCPALLAELAAVRDRMAAYLIAQYEHALASPRRSHRYQALNWLFYAGSARLDSPLGQAYVWDELQRGRDFEDPRLAASWRARILEVVAGSGHPRAGAFFLARVSGASHEDRAVAGTLLVRWMSVRRTLDARALATFLELFHEERRSGRGSLAGALLLDLLAERLVEVVPAAGAASSPRDPSPRPGDAP